MDNADRAILFGVLGTTVLACMSGVSAGALFLGAVLGAICGSYVGAILDVRKLTRDTASKIKSYAKKEDHNAAE